MKTSLILTLIGPDRPGLVSAVASCAAAAGANWLDSRMAQLAGQFAGLVHLEVDPDTVDDLEAALHELEGKGLRITIERGREVAVAALHPVQLDLVGHDHLGIVQDIATVLARHDVTIESLETSCEPASMSGEPLFRARAELGVPASTDLHELKDALEALANALMVDLDLQDQGVEAR